VWTTYNCLTLRHYHDLYLLMDVELLCDVFENFRQTMITDIGLDCLYFPSLPNMTLQIALKKTDARLDLITDGVMYLTIESGIRGGISGGVATLRACKTIVATVSLRYRITHQLPDLLTVTASMLHVKWNPYRLAISSFSREMTSTNLTCSPSKLTVKSVRF